jgi:hypothetical protein
MQRRWHFLLLAALMLMGWWLASPTVFAQGTTITVTGRVVDQQTNTGLAGVRVCASTGRLLCTYAGTTDANGNFMITTGLPAGTTLNVFVRGGAPVPDTLAPTNRRVMAAPLALTNQDFFVPVALTYTKTEEIAHRGDRVTSPENTFEAVKRATEKQATYTEIDVFLADRGNTEPADDEVILSHGSLYKDEPRPVIGDIPTQVYGPTAACFDRRIETDADLDALLADCDVGTEMMIPIGNSWWPPFQEQRFPRLPAILDTYPTGTIYMVELKTTEIPGLTAEQRAARDTLLGGAVSDILAARLNSGQLAEVWVTSFSDAALDGVTDPRILKMRQVNADLIPGNAGIVAEVDNAVIRGYDALNFNLPSISNRVGLLNASTWGDYTRARGIKVAAYTLLGQGNNSATDAIEDKADLFMTDIVDDLQVKNGDRPDPHPIRSAFVQTEPSASSCLSVITNREVFNTTLRVRIFRTDTEGDFIVIPGLTDAEGYITIGLNALGRAEFSYTEENITITRVVPRYTDGNFEPTTDTTANSYPITVDIANEIRDGVFFKVQGEHSTFPNVDPLLEVEPCIGTGDVAISLRWYSVADLDLYVTEPNGETIFYGNPTSNTGGQLDQDANAACSNPTTTPIENIFWAPTLAPTGTYTVSVDIYDRCGVNNIPFELTVRNDGNVQLTNQGDPGDDGYTITFTYPPTPPLTETESGTEEGNLPLPRPELPKPPKAKPVP